MLIFLWHKKIVTVVPVKQPWCDCCKVHEANKEPHVLLFFKEEKCGKAQWGNRGMPCRPCICYIQSPLTGTPLQQLSLTFCPIASPMTQAPLMQRTRPVHQGGYRAIWRPEVSVRRLQFPFLRKIICLVLSILWPLGVHGLVVCLVAVYLSNKCPSLRALLWAARKQTNCEMKQVMLPLWYDFR